MASEPEQPIDIEKELRENALVRHYGVDPRFLDLKRAHHMVETGHRKMAWKMVLDHATVPRVADRVQTVVERSMALWQLYRDGVARTCRIERPVLAGREA